MATKKTLATIEAEATEAKAKKATKAATDEVKIEIPPLKISYLDMAIEGTAPLICHAWADKAKKMILDKQQKKASAGRETRRPEKDFAESLYWLSPKPDFEPMSDEEIMDAVAKGEFGFPSIAFKSAAIDGAYQTGAISKKTIARASFMLLGEFIKLEGEPRPRQDMVRIGMGTADIRFRAEFLNWRATLHVSYNELATSPEQILNMMNIGGYSVGVGEWRPAKDGQFGTFKVV